MAVDYEWDSYDKTLYEVRPITGRDVCQMYWDGKYRHLKGTDACLRFRPNYIYFSSSWLAWACIQQGKQSRRKKYGGS